MSSENEPYVAIYHWKALLKGISIQLLKFYFVNGTVYNLHKTSFSAYCRDLLQLYTIITISVKLLSATCNNCKLCWKQHQRMITSRYNSISKFLQVTKTASANDYKSLQQHRRMITSRGQSQDGPIRKLPALSQPIGI